MSNDCKVKIESILIKIREGEELKLSPEEAKKLQKVLNKIFPNEIPDPVDPAKIYPSTPITLPEPFWKAVEKIEPFRLEWGFSCERGREK